MRQEASQSAILMAVIPLGLIAGLITVLFIEDTFTRIVVGGVVGASVGFSVRAFVKYWLLRG